MVRTDCLPVLTSTRSDALHRLPPAGLDQSYDRHDLLRSVKEVGQRVWLAKPQWNLLGRKIGCASLLTRLLAFGLFALALIAFLPTLAASSAAIPAAESDSTLQPDAFDRLRGDYRLPDGRVLFVGQFDMGSPYYQDGDLVVFLRPSTGTTYATEANGEIAFSTDTEGRGTAVTIRHPGEPGVTGERIQPYTEEEVRFANEETTLAGTLLLPPGPGPHPAVVFIHGSGRIGRENLRNLGDRFARAGIAALIYDKRADYSPTIGRRSYDDLAGDALAAVTLLKQRPEVNPRMIGLWGISEGGWIGPLAASRSTDVAFVIPVSASGVIPLRQELWLEENNLRRDGISDEVVDTVGKAWKMIASARELPLSEGIAENAYLLSDAHYDPVPTLERVHQPVLAIFGAEDKVVPPAESADIMREALERGGNRHHTIRIFPGANHSLLASRDGFQVVTDGTIRYAPGYLDAMTGWVQEVASGGVPAGGVDDAIPPQEFPTRDVFQVGWFGSAPVQLALMAFFLLAFVPQLVAWLGNRLLVLRRRTLVASSAPSRLRALAGLVSTLGLLLLLGLLAFLTLVLLAAGEGLAQVGGRPIAWLLLQILSVLAGVAIVAFLAGLAVGRDHRGWSRGERVRVGLAALAAVLFVPWLLYWNLLPV